MRMPLRARFQQRNPLCRTSSGTQSRPSQMWAFIQSLARPMRTTRYFFRTQRSISKTMIRPPTTPKANPGRLLPPGQVPVR